MSTQRPLVVRFGALGDMVMITPLLRVLAERYGEVCDVLGSGAWTKHIFEGLPWVGDVLSIGGRKTPYYLSAEQRALVKQLKQRGVGPLWLLEDMPKAWRLMQRAGFEAQHCVRMDDFPRGVDEHTVKHWLRLAQETPSAFPAATVSDPGLMAFNCELHCSTVEHEDCQRWLESLNIRDQAVILIQAGSKKTMKGGRPDRSSNLKFWPTDRWAILIKKIQEKLPEAFVLICGAPNEQDLAVEIKQAAGSDQVLAVADQLPLRRLVALMHRAHSCVSVDTGPAHMAAAINCPLVVLFGQTNARLYHPVSSESPVQIVSQTPINEVAPGSSAWAACNSMDGISVELAFDAWLQVDARA